MDYRGVFRTIFDRLRLVLSSVRKLKEFPVKGLYICADLPLNERSKPNPANIESNKRDTDSDSASNSHSPSSQSTLDSGSATTSQV